MLFAAHKQKIRQQADCDRAARRQRRLVKSKRLFPPKHSYQYSMIHPKDRLPLSQFHDHEAEPRHPALPKDRRPPLAHLPMRLQSFHLPGHQAPFGHHRRHWHCREWHSAPHRHRAGGSPPQLTLLLLPVQQLPHRPPP